MRGMHVKYVGRSKGQQRELGRKRRNREKRAKALSGPVVVTFVDPATLRGPRKPAA